MANNCVDCSCKQLKLDSELGKNLHEMNNSKIKGASMVIKDAEVCDYRKIFPRALYSIWCMFKNIIASVSWLLDRVKLLEDRSSRHDKALRQIIESLERSGAWQGGLDGGMVSGRNIATGNINIFGGQPDGNSFIRTSKDPQENDLAGGL